MNSDDYTWFSLSLRIVGQGLDLDKVTSDLELTPTALVRRGQPVRAGSRIKAERDVWLYDFERKSEKGLDHLLSVAHAALLPKRDAIQALSRQHEVCLWLSYQSNLAQGGFDVKPEHLAFMTSLGITLTVSILSFGDARG